MPEFKAPFYSSLHSHVLLENVGAHWNCDGRKLYADYTWMKHEDGKDKKRYSCRACDFDLCPKCMAVSLEIKANINSGFLAKKSLNGSLQKKLFIDKEILDNIPDNIVQKMKRLEVENSELKEKIRNIKTMISEIQMELNSLMKELNSELREILITNAGDALLKIDAIKDFAFNAVSIIPVIGPIAGALKLVYNILSTPASVLKNKSKVDKIQNILKKIENLENKLQMIE